MKKLRIILLVLNILIIFGCNSNETQKRKSISKPKINPNIILLEADNIVVLNEIEKSVDSIKFKYGTFAGECIEYCDTELTITSKGVRYIESSPNYRKDLPKLPPKIKTYNISFNDYNKIINSINIEKITKLDNRIGCPDCDDGGAEWIEIKYDNIIKKVTIKYGAEIEGIKNLMKIIREIQFKK
ncbi:hypothetical protein [uncultured Aquimarina sp.]|uniref:hypothetical protein n=1 Tax=uncultured Aquimarina sp. TaxID=575652 RepID=UPI0026344261|nr:hypothetical protein [uncultured Aquimarina sp.]